MWEVSEMTKNGLRRRMNYPKFSRNERSLRYLKENSMNIEIIPIAVKKLQKRKIRQEWVIDVVKNPEQVLEGYGCREVAQKKIIINEKQYLIRVVYERNDSKITVMTAYVTSQVERYWKKEEGNED